MTPPSTDQRIIFALSSFAGLISGADPGHDPEKLLYKRVMHKLKQYEAQLGKWDIVWGPCVVAPSTFYYPTNAMYVAQSASDPANYVIAVAGTNPYSVFDWMIEDALVHAQLPWLFDETGGAAISLGTGIGLAILLNMIPTVDRPGAGKTLRQFLFDIEDKNIILTTAGHSLGGALAPALGLWLMDIQRLWDPFKRAKLASLPTGGPTAGNDVFAAYSDCKLPTSRWWNSLDVVPQAWNTRLLSRIPELYQAMIPGDRSIDVLIQWARDVSTKGSYTHIQSTAEAFEGDINEGIIDPHRSPIDNFLGQVAYQHTAAYLNYFALPGVNLAPLSGFMAQSKPVQLAVLERASNRSGIPIPSDLLDAAVESAPITVPVAGKPVLLPESACDPATRSLAQQVQTELQKAAA